MTAMHEGRFSNHGSGKAKDNHSPHCSCSGDNMPHVDRCACCDCGLGDRRERDNERKRLRRSQGKDKA